MSSVALLKPRSNTTSMIGGDFGTVDLSDYYIKTRSITPRYWSPDTDVTGDGDESPCWENTAFLYGRVLIDGWMLGSNGLGPGIVNMVTEARADSQDPTYNLIYWLGKDAGSTDNRGIQHDVLLKRMRIGWRRNATFIGISIDCLKNGKLTEIDSSVAAASRDLEKGKGRTGEILESPGNSDFMSMGTNGGSGGDDLLIKLWKADFDFHAEIAEETGDGDNYPHYSSSQFLQCTARFRGYLPAVTANQAGTAELGLDETSTNTDHSIIDNVNGQVTPKYDLVKVYLGANRSINMNVSVVSMRWGLERRGAFIPVDVVVRKQALADGTESLVET